MCVCAKTSETGLIPHLQPYSKRSFTCQGELVPTQVPKDLICFHTYRILHSHIQYIARSDVNRCPGWHRGRGENSSTKREWTWIRQWMSCCNMAKKVPRHTKHGINTCSHSHLSLLHVSIPYIETSIYAEYMRTCTSFPSSETLFPLCAFNSHLPSSFALSPIYFGFSLLPSLRLSQKWPSMVISFVLFLGGRYGTFAPHHWSLIAFDLLLMWLKNSFFPFPSGKKGK